MTDTIEETADELLGVHDDLVRVLGHAYYSSQVEADEMKGIKKNNHINTSSSLFGVHAASVFEIVQRFINEKKHSFKQIGQWFNDAQENWSLIDRHGADILRFGNVQEIKNDVKILTKISELW